MPKTVPKTGQSIGKYRIVRELGARMPHVFAAHVTSIIGDPELVVLEVLSSSDVAKDAMDAFARRARRLALVRHPNIARVREVLVLKDRVAIASDYVEGELFADLLALDTAAPKKLGLVERLRVLVDVLSGLSSIHVAPELASADDKEGVVPMHGSLCPRSVLVGTDGSARIVHLVRAADAAGHARAADAAGYVAPELLLGDETAGIRADLYAVGVMLWEALTGRTLFEETSEKAVLTRQLAGPLPIATIPADASWAKSLADVAARALEVDPTKRHASAAELAGALRLAVQARLAPAARVGSVVSSLAKAKIEARAQLRPAKKAKIGKPEKDDAAKPKKAAAADGAKPEDLESTEKKAVPVVPRAKTNLPSLASPDDEVEDTRRVEIDSIADDDLWTDDAIVDVAPAAPKSAPKKSMPPPLRPRSIAPQAPVTATPPPVVATSAKPPPVATLIGHPAPPLQVQAAVSTEDMETIAPVVSPALAVAPTAHAVEAGDSKIEVVPPLEDPQRKKRRAVVLAFVGFSALILLVALIKYATKEDGKTASAAAAARTATATATTTTTPAVTATATATAIATATETAPTPPAFVAEPVATQAASQPETTTPAHPVVQSSRPPAPPAKPKKRPPHSNYEPEGI